MHYPRHHGARRLIFVFAVLGGLSMISLVIHNWAPPDRPAKPDPTTVVAKATKRPQPTVKHVKPLPTIVKNQAIDNYLTQLHFSGTALIVRNDQIILRKGYLDRNREQHLPNETTTPYYIGSSQKAIIAAAILQLQDAGKLKTSDPINKYLPGFPNGHNIKLKNLLTHTSGLVGHHETGAAITPAELVHDVEQRGIDHQPGQWHYLDSNYTVLAYLVEKLSGQSLMTYLQRHIFKPAGMDQTGTYETFKSVTNHSTGYQISKGQYIQPQLGSLSQLFGVGNMYMPVSDMYKFDHALMTGRLISKRSRQEMLTAGSSSTYGMGFYVDPGSYSSHGIVSGWNVINNFSHSGKTYVVLMTNVQNNIRSFGHVAGDIYSFLNKADEATAKPTSSPN